MKISPVTLLAVANVAATAESSSSERTKLSSIAFDKLQQTDLIGRAVHHAQLQSSQDDVTETCLNETQAAHLMMRFLSSIGKSGIRSDLAGAGERARGPQEDVAEEPGNLIWNALTKLSFA